MSETLAEFFAKPFKRSCGSGKKRDTLAGHKFRARAFAAAMVFAGATSGAFGQQKLSDRPANLKTQMLSEAFTRYSVSESGDTVLSYKTAGENHDCLRVQGMVDKLMTTPTGAAVLKYLQDNDCVISMAPAIQGKLGVFSAEANAVVLNAAAPDSVLISTLVHEATHARQHYTSGYNLDFTLDLATLFTMGRAMEADATKNQVVASYELAQRGDSSAWNAALRDCAYPANAFSKTITENPSDKTGAERAAFLAYYADRNYVEQYEIMYSAAFIHTCRDTPRDKLNTLGSVSVPVDSIAAKICVSEKGQYVPAQALTDSTTYYVSDYIKQTLERTTDFLAKRKREADPSLRDEDIKRDTSCDKLYVLKFTGGFEKPKALQKQENATEAPQEKGAPVLLRRLDALKAGRG